MGILGQVQLKKRTRKVPVGVTEGGEPFYLVVTAPRLQLISELDRMLPTPEPPAKRDEQGRVKLRRNPKTGDLIKNAQGQAIPELDLANPQFLSDVENVEKARTIAMIFECVAFPGSSTLAQESFPSHVDYQLARWKELEDAGIDVGAYKALSQACVDLGRPMSSEEVEDARAVLGADKETQAEIKEAMRERGEEVPAGK